MSRNLEQFFEIPGLEASLDATNIVQFVRDAITLYNGAQIIANEVDQGEGSFSASFNSSSGLPLTRPISELTIQEQVAALAFGQTPAMNPSQGPFESAEAFAARLAESQMFVQSAADAQLILQNLQTMSIEDPSVAMQIAAAFEAKADQTREQFEAEGFPNRARPLDAAARGILSSTLAAADALNLIPNLRPPRRSSDHALVSREPHEYQYCSETPLKTLIMFGGAGDIPSESTGADGGTYLDAAIAIIRDGLQKAIDGVADENGHMFTINSDLTAVFENSIPDSEDFEGIMGGLNFTRRGFSFGNWVDSPNIRKLIERIRKTVRLARSENGSMFIRDLFGQSLDEFVHEQLLTHFPFAARLAALREWIFVDNDVDGTTEGAQAMADSSLINVIDPANSNALVRPDVRLPFTRSSQAPPAP